MDLTYICYKCFKKKSYSEMYISSLLNRKPNICKQCRQKQKERRYKIDETLHDFLFHK